MNYLISTTNEITAKYNKEGMYETIISNLEGASPNLRDAVEFEVTSFDDQLDTEVEGVDSAWDTEWATKEIIAQVTEDLLRDATRLYLFAVTDPRSGFKYLRDVEVDDAEGMGEGTAKVIEFAGHEITILTSEDEDTIISIEKK